MSTHLCTFLHIYALHVCGNTVDQSYFRLSGVAAFADGHGGYLCTHLPRLLFAGVVVGANAERRGETKRNLRNLLNLRAVFGKFMYGNTGQRSSLLGPPPKTVRSKGAIRYTWSHVPYFTSSARWRGCGGETLVVELEPQRSSHRRGWLCSLCTYGDLDGAVAAAAAKCFAPSLQPRARVLLLRRFSTSSSLTDSRVVPAVATRFPPWLLPLPPPPPPPPPLPLSLPRPPRRFSK